MDELTMFASLRPDSEVLPADERAALRVSLFGSSADGSGADPALDAPPSIADDPESTLIDLEPTRTRVWAEATQPPSHPCRPGHRRRRGGRDDDGGDLPRPHDRTGRHPDPGPEPA